tara:strand:- start:182 stop:952 length:771 start_codon:yes stop_codon:yes gene_type:complete
MGTPHQQFVDINDCVSAYLDESEQGINKYFKISQLAFRAMDELGLDFFYSIKSSRLPIKSNLTVDLPADYLNYTKVGVLNSKGEIITLSYNNKLTTYADLFPDRLTKTQDQTLLNWAYPYNGVFSNFWNGSTFGNLYGVPSGAPFMGSFKIDPDNGVILLNETYGYEYIMLEYVSSPTPGQTYYVPLQFKEAIIAYLSWKDIKSMPSTRKGNLGDKRDRKHEYYNERRLAIARYKPFRTNQAYDQNLENQRLTVKA